MRATLLLFALAAACFGLLITRPDPAPGDEAVARAREVALGAAAIVAALAARVAWARRDR